MVYPIVIELANHYGKKVNIGKMNVDLEQEKINNRSIPPILIFKDGEVVDKHLGVLSKRTHVVSVVLRTLGSASLHIDTNILRRRQMGICLQRTSNTWGNNANFSFLEP